jgi:hypothetical protein
MNESPATYELFAPTARINGLDCVCAFDASIDEMLKPGRKLEIISEPRGMLAEFFGALKARDLT